MVDDGSTDESAEIAERFRRPRREVPARPAGQRGPRRGAQHGRAPRVRGVPRLRRQRRRRPAPRLRAPACGARRDRLGLRVRERPPADLARQRRRPASSAPAFDRTQAPDAHHALPASAARRTAWNKLFRRSFWDHHGLRFPRGRVLRGHARHAARPLPRRVRRRHRADRSTCGGRARGPTCRSRSVGRRRRRCATASPRSTTSAASSASRGSRSRRPPTTRAVIASDLRYFLDVLPRADEEYRRLFLDLANEFIDRADSWVLDQPLRDRPAEVGARPPSRAARAARGAALRGGGPPRARRSASAKTLATATIPTGRTSASTCPRATYRLGRRARARLPAERRALGGGHAPDRGLRLHQHDRRAGDSARSASSWSPAGAASCTGGLHLRTESVARPDVTEDGSQQVAGLDGSGFVATLDASRLKRRGRWQEGTWEIGAEIRAEGLTRTSWRPVPASLHAVPLAELERADGARLRAGLGANGKLTVEVAGRKAFVTSAQMDGAVLVLQGTPGSRGDQGAEAPREPADRRGDAGVSALRRPVAAAAHLPCAASRSMTSSTSSTSGTRWPTSSRRGRRRLGSLARRRAGRQAACPGRRRCRSGRGRSAVARSRSG